MKRAVIDLPLLCCLMLLAVLTPLVMARRGQTRWRSKAQDHRVPIVAPLANLLTERVIELPEDGLVWATIVFTSDGWQTNAVERKVVSWFDTNPRLAKLKAQTKFYHYLASDPVYSHKPINKPGYSFRDVVKDQFPCIIVQTYEGTKVYKVSGQNIPRNSNVLANGIADALRKAKNDYAVAQSNGDLSRAGRILPLRPRPRPNPEPCPTPTPVAVPVTPVGPPEIPDDAGPVVEDDAPAGPNLGFVIGLFVIGALGAGIVMFRNAVDG